MIDTLSQPFNHACALGSQRDRKRRAGVRAMRTLALVDVSEIKANRSLANLDLTRRRWWNLYMDQLKYLWIAMLVDVNGSGLHDFGRLMEE